MARLLLMLCIFTSIPSIAQKKTLWVETVDVILQGTIGLSSYQDLYVGQEYHFTIFCNSKDFDLEITSENLEVAIVPGSNKRTSGLEFKIIPIDTGYCFIQLSVGNDGKRVSSLISRTFYASHYPVPPVFISKIRSGGAIVDLDEDAKLSCSYDKSLGIFDGFSIRSWTAQLNEMKFSGEGNELSSELIEAVNQVDHGFLIVTVELESNRTGYSTSEAVFILR